MKPHVWTTRCHLHPTTSLGLPQVQMFLYQQYIEGLCQYRAIVDNTWRGKTEHQRARYGLANESPRCCPPFPWYSRELHSCCRILVRKMNERDCRARNTRVVGTIMHYLGIAVGVFSCHKGLSTPSLHLLQIKRYISNHLSFQEFIDC